MNAAGQGLPLLAAVVAVPLLIRSLGAERVGLLTLGWAVIGYFSLFDLGLGRALTQAVSARQGSDEGETGALVRVALRLMLWLGLAGGALLALGVPWLVTGAMRITPALQGEARASFYLLALSVPVVVVTSGLRGVLEARHRFDLVNAIRAPMGVFTFAAPLALLPFTDSLTAVIALLVAGRVGGLVAHAAACVRVLPAIGHLGSGSPPPLRPLLRNGGWMTVSNVVSPLMVTADRFVIASIASAAVVAYYTVPFEVASKVLILPLSIAAPLFASFAAAREPDARASLLVRGMALTCAAVFPATLLLVLGAPEGLHAWMGADFAARAAPVLALLGLGIYFNSVAQAPFAMLQATGRSELTAKLHLVELPLYLATVVLLVRRFGIEGAAAAWLLRAAVDCLLLTAASLRATPEARLGRRTRVWTAVVVATAAMVGATLLRSAAADARVAYGAVSVLLVGASMLVAARSRRTREAAG